MDIREMLRRLQKGQSDRAIAREMKVNRKTVGRYRVWATGQGLLEGSLPSLSDLQRLLDETMAGPPPPQNSSTVEPYRQLVLDDFGLKPLRSPAPEDLYDIINERYERGSILLTSNRSPEEWPELFGNPLLASAGLDRLAHGAQVVIITGPSFRAQGPPPSDKEVHIELSDPA